MKKFVAFLGIAVIGMLAWIAAGPQKTADPIRVPEPHAMGAPPPIDSRPPLDTPHPLDTPTILSMSDPEAPRPMIVPVAGVDRAAMRDMFDDVRGDRRHEAIDILALRGTPVIATDDGVVKKLFTSKPGGLTVYEFDPDQRF